MKKVLVIGEKSYLSLKFQDHVMNFKNKLIFEVISARNGEWEKQNFEEFDSVIFFAGIAHVKESKIDKSLYYKVNCELAYKVAEKASNDSVRHFVYISSMSVYGNNVYKITSETIENPSTEYGKSKLKAEKLLSELENKDFKIAIVRPPMVYGYDSIGNYQKLSKLNKLLRIFPDTKNKRSMIYIENLNEFLLQIILREKNGVMHPQNKEYVCTTDLYKKISQYNERKVFFIPFKKKIISLLRVNVLNKLFGDLYYEKNLSEFEFKYHIVDFDKSIQKSEGEGNE